MPLFMPDDDVARLSSEAVAEKADEYIRQLQSELDSVRAKADASTILEQKYLSLSQDYSSIGSLNVKLQSEADDRLAEMAQYQTREQQFRSQSIEKDVKVERLGRDVTELHESRRKLKRKRDSDEEDIDEGDPKRVKRVIHPKTMVWIDLENGGIPADCPPDQFRKRIALRMAWEGMRSDCKIRAFVALIDKEKDTKMDALRDSGVELHEAGFQGADAADGILQEDIGTWVERYQNQPHNAILVTGDKGFREVAELLIQHGHSLTTASVGSSTSQELADLETGNKKWLWREFLFLPDQVNEAVALKLNPNYNRRGEKGFQPNSGQRRKLNEMTPQQKLEREELRRKWVEDRRSLKIADDKKTREDNEKIRAERAANEKKIA